MNTGKLETLTSDIKSKSRTSKQDGPIIIITTPSTKIDPAARKKIRSHVMRGKNRKPVDPHRYLRLGSWINDCQEPSQELTGTMPLHQSIPTTLGTDISHIQLVDGLNPYKAKLIFSWFSTLKTRLYPVETIVQPPMDQWIEYLAHDRAYVECVLFVTQAASDWVREGKIGKASLYHLNAAMNNLRQTLAADPLKTTDSTIAVVVTLGTTADMLQDPEVARKHIEGLYHLVQTRGGIRALKHNPQLQIKVLRDRADLGHAITTGSKPLFFSEGFSWDPYLASRCEPLTRSPASRRAILQILSSPVQAPDQRLINVYLDLQEFSVATNLAYQTGNKIPFEPFLETVVSAQYRLLTLQREHLETDGNEATMLILGMVAFSTTTFLQIRDLPIKFCDLARRLRDRLRTFGQYDKDEKAELTKLKLWFLFVAAISVVTEPEDETLLGDAARVVLGRLGMLKASWTDVRDVLREHMWIDWLHSGFGKTFHAKVVGHGHLL